MFDHLPNHKILKKALCNGGEFADLFYETSRSVKILADDHKIESVTAGTDTGAGLRVISNLKTTCGYTNEINPKSLDRLATDLSSSLKGVQADNHFQLKAVKASSWIPIKISPESVPLGKKIDLIKNAQNLAWGIDSRIVQARLSYSDVRRDMEIANSKGEYTKNQTTLVVFSVQVTASDGKEYFKGYESMGGHAGFELIVEENVEKVVQTAVLRALNNLSAERAKGGTMPVVISSQAGGTMVHEAVGHGLEADLACQGLSVYEGKIGQKLASDLITVVDDPTYPNKRGSYSFDDEGVQAERVVLIDKGILKTFLYDRLTAMKMKTVSNAHGRRESYAHHPIVRMTNTMILPGKDDPEKIVSSVEKGLFVKMMGGGEVNTVNGDFVFEVAEGYRIEKGKVGEPVRGATLTGSSLEVMKSIDRVGSDLGFSIGTCGKDGQNAPVADAMPTIRIPEMVVGGVV